MESDKKNIILVGSRKSELALIQTNHVIDTLKKANPNVEFQIETMTTLGDRILNVSLPKIGEKALFTKDLEDRLSNNTLHFVVHSLKDLPTTLPEGLVIGAVFERDDPRDALVLKEQFKNCTLNTLPSGSVIGTSSLRRTAQLKGRHPHLSVACVRGNLNTRLKKLDAPDGEYAALLLAHAGLERMGWAERVSQVLPCSEMMYAVGQGALAVECRAADRRVLRLLAPFSHAPSYCRTLAERSFMKTLGGGCSAPVGVSTKLKQLDSNFKLSITGAVWSLDGATKLEHSLEQTFAQITHANKHKLSPEEENERKKLKIAEKGGNPIEVLNQKITDKTGYLNCEDTSTSDKSHDGRIFCGMSVNENVPIDVIIKCSNLGEDLAKALIEMGALDVMKVTQDLIRSSAEKSS